ncbi:MAG TPA: hypothetical protein VN922_19470 [Bacteroidia bacterium]|nr:hypothetical protein [Bacteroidia bacterium]
MLQYTTEAQSKKLKELGMVINVEKTEVTIAYARKWLLQKYDVYYELKPSDSYWVYSIYHIHKLAKTSVKLTDSRSQFDEYDLAEERGLNHLLTIVKPPHSA